MGDSADFAISPLKLGRFHQCLRDIGDSPRPGRKVCDVYPAWTDAWDNAIQFLDMAHCRANNLHEYADEAVLARLSALVLNGMRPDKLQEDEKHAGHLHIRVHLNPWEPQYFEDYCNRVGGYHVTELAAAREDLRDLQQRLLLWPVLFRREWSWIDLALQTLQEIEDRMLDARSRRAKAARLTYTADVSAATCRGDRG